MATEAKTARALCPVCDDTGWKTIEGGRVTRCDCRVRARGASLEDAARIPRRYARCGFENFVTDLPDLTSMEHQSLHTARFRAGRFVEEYPNEKTGLLFIGPTGTGKTHLGVAVIRELMQKGISCLFCDYHELLRKMRHAYNPSVQATEMDVLRPVLEAEVVLIDDLGASATQTPWERDTVGYILNKRYSDEKTTIVTTYLLDRASPVAEIPSEQSVPQFGHNKNREEAKAALRDRTLGERIGDQMRARLHEMCRKVEISARDFRERGK